MHKATRLEVPRIQPCRVHPGRSPCAHEKPAATRCAPSAREWRWWPAAAPCVPHTTPASLAAGPQSCASGCSCWWERGGRQWCNLLIPLRSAGCRVAKRRMAASPRPGAARQPLNASSTHAARLTGGSRSGSALSARPCCQSRHQLWSSRAPCLAAPPPWLPLLGWLGWAGWAVWLLGGFKGCA